MYMPSDIKQQGLTLVELMMVIVIAGILLSLSFVMMTSSVDNSRLQSATEAFYYDMLQARNHAVTNSKSVYVNVTTGATWCYGLSDVTSCDCNTDACALNSQKLVTSSTEYPNVSVASSNIDSEFVFEPIQGEVASGINTSPAVFTFTSTTSNNTSQVNITSSGQVTSCSNSLEGYTAC